MAEHPEKKDTNLPISMPSSLKEKLSAFADHSNISNSELGFNILVEWLEGKEREARILNKLLGFKISDE
jgi:hypothetical protein